MVLALDKTETNIFWIASAVSNGWLACRFSCTVWFLVFFRPSDTRLKWGCQHKNASGWLLPIISFAFSVLRDRSSHNTVGKEERLDQPKARIGDWGCRGHIWLRQNYMFEKLRSWELSKKFWEFHWRRWWVGKTDVFSQKCDQNIVSRALAFDDLFSKLVSTLCLLLCRMSGSWKMKNKNSSRPPQVLCPYRTII